MKKILCLLLVVWMVAVTLVSCGDKTEREGPLYTYNEAPNVSEIPLEAFTVVANGVNTGGVFAATVDKAHQNVWGEYINVYYDDISDLKIAAGDKIQVVPKRIEATTPITVHAQEIEILAYGKNHLKNDSGYYVIMNEGYGYEAFTIPAVSEFEISHDFPSESALKEKKYAYSVLEYPFAYHYRVYDIDGEIIYLARLGALNKITTAMVGKLDTKLSVGDFITVEATKVYHWDGFSASFIYAEDVMTVSHMREEEIWQAYVDANQLSAGSFTVDKPVIYLYPEADTECSVKVTLANGELTCTYPEHGTNGWQNFIARPDGTLVFPDGSEYYCLYWEAKCNLSPDFEEGFCVKGSDTAQFLADVLPKIGLSAREANEFIIYWLPILQENPYNLISFQKEAYTSVAELEITPTPDSLLRVYMTAKPMDAYVEIEPQTFDGFERKGFTVVEWGGSIIE